ncbi:5-methylcytosine-specific restriction enzyme A [Phyllobacterium sp. CL33Tsu]|uniref:HNH endonuclease n=1 Tax=Phyllobacterium sp. CL33Tsu TaxID=1798191 RepID=UPI0008EEFD73|nr:HNH endonuclease [Phyllobacterium sp. CL33Tsu]SFJ14795.1 5-methylcytosine-specific restriction enzyme A [Phyllobacterium sp. CL33Tsu]
MPVTRGHGNPDWTRDETILALDLLYRFGKPLDRRHDAVAELSNLLRHSQLHPPEKRTETFRNADGVALKLQNLFSAVEPGRGLTYSKTDFEVVADFPRSGAGKLAEIARTLRTSLEMVDPRLPTVDPSSATMRFVEGRWLTIRHRQRDARLRRRLLTRAKGTALRCEMCDFTPPEFDLPVRESFFEAHHRTPLAEAERERETKVSDMALLCACCHRLIHRLIACQKQWIGVEDARSYLKSAL